MGATYDTRRDKPHRGARSLSGTPGRRWGIKVPLRALKSGYHVAWHQLADRLPEGVSCHRPPGGMAYLLRMYIQNKPGTCANQVVMFGVSFSLASSEA